MAKQLSELPRLTLQDVSKHSTAEDLWTVVDNVVYDLTKFQNLHPGGDVVLRNVAGQDSTEAFFGLHKKSILDDPKYARLRVGTIGECKVTGKGGNDGVPPPYSKPLWLSEGYSSPYMDDSHRKLQAAINAFVTSTLIPDAIAREADGKRPSQAVFEAAAKLYIPQMKLGPGEHLHGLTLPGGLKGEDFTYLHELVVNQELVRPMQRGYSDGFWAGFYIGAPPIKNFGQPALKKRILPELFSAQKFVCLAITEAFAGSDVAGLQTTAVKSKDGKHWIVNGTKKWITNGTFSDYFATGVRTGEGLTMLLIERTHGGVETRPIKTGYSPTAGTAYVTFTNTLVPVENTLGEVNNGLRVILSNFNHERWVMCCNSARTSRHILEDCLKWANQRKVFKARLIDQPVIRGHLASMIAEIEAGQSWLETITYQMVQMNYAQQTQYLAGPIASLKAFLTKTENHVADRSVQVFGGRGITATGMGANVFNFNRTHHFNSVLGGTEDILGGLSVSQALKQSAGWSKL